MGTLFTRRSRASLLFLPIACSACLGSPDGPSSSLDPEALLSREAPDLPRSTYLQLEVPGRAAQDALGRQLDIDRVAGDTVWAYASPSQLAWLERKGLSYAVLPHPGFNPGARMGLLDRAGKAHWDHFPTYSEYEQFLQQLAADHPDLCRLVELGPSTNQVRPHTLWALKISKSPDAAEDEPEVLLTSTMHGDETTGYILLLKLAEELLTLYPTDAEIAGLVDGLEIWLNPLSNPDGTYYVSDSTVDGAIREYTDASGDAAWMDPNRNFPDKILGDHPDGEVWWAETEAMMAHAGQHHFTLSANFHGGAELVNYPWDCQPGLHPDTAWLVILSRGYADLCHADGWPGYMSDQDNGVTNGYAWYQVNGSRQDYMTYFHAGREVTIELSAVKNPPASELEAFWQANRQALLAYLGQALKGVRGTVKNTSGAPLDATVTVIGHDTSDDRSAVVTDPAVGDYHRLLAPGTYDLLFEADGYIPQEHDGIVVTSRTATRLDVVLSQAGRADLLGRVLDERGMPLPGVRVELLGTAVAEVTSRRSGDFRFPDLAEGRYTLRFSKDGYETLTQPHDLIAGQRAPVFRLGRVVVLLSLDLEASDGGLRPGGSPAPGFTWGNADALGAHSGSRVWGAGRGGSYPDDASWSLEWGKLVLPAGSPRLTFWHRYATEAGYDGGRLMLSADGGGTFQVITPEGGYPEAGVSALGGPGYAGSSGGWAQASFDLSAWAGRAVVVRWVFASDSGVTDQGWRIDDLQLTGRKLP